MFNDLETPFQPTNPVRPENLKGRKDIIHKIIRYVPNALNHEAQHFFLTGTYGAGKTSIADFVTEYAHDEYNFACAYTLNKDNESLDVLASNILVNLLNNVPLKSRLSSVEKFFGEYISEVEFVCTKLRFEVDENKQEKIKNNFIVYLNQAFEDLKEYYDGMFIVR